MAVGQQGVEQGEVLRSVVSHCQGEHRKVFFALLALFACSALEHTFLLSLHGLAESVVVFSVQNV